MSDIVERLFSHANAEDVDAWMTCKEAADEIERLRDVLKNVQHSRVLQGKAITDASNEITRLRALNAELVEVLLFVDRWATYKVNKPEKPTSAEDAIQIISTGIKDLVARAAITKGESNG